MMKKFLVYIFAISSVFNVSCNKNEGENVGDDKGKDVIEVYASVKAQSEVASAADSEKTEFVSGDVFSIFTSGNGFETITTDYEVGTTEMRWSVLGLPAEVENVNFSACYPAQDIAGDGTFTFDIANAENKDLLLSELQNVKVRTYDPVNFTFVHAMHQLVINFNSTDYSSDELATLETACEAQSVCVVDGLSGKVKEVKTDVATFTANGAAASFILVPQMTSSVNLTFSIDGRSQTLTLGELLEKLGNPQEELLAGCKLVIDLTLIEGRDLISVGNATINPWEDQTSVDGEITMKK